MTSIVLTVARVFMIEVLCNELNKTNLVLLPQVHTMYSKLDNKNKATLLEISDVANILAEAPMKLAEGFQYFLQVRIYEQKHH